jgi:hypothetical protein
MSSRVSSSNRGRVRARPDEAESEVAAATADAPGTPEPPVETVGSKKRVVVQRAKDADVVLAQCRKLHAELIAKAAATDLSGVARMIPDGIPSNIVEVSELPEAQVLEGMEVIALQVAHQVLSKKGFSMEVPSRAASNQVYVKEWDRIVLGGKRSSRTFLNVKEARKSAITLRVMQLLRRVAQTVHITNVICSIRTLNSLSTRPNPTESWTTWRLLLAVPEVICTW